MNLRLLFSTLLCLCFFGATSQITTVGLIGNATPGGWDTDTDMVQDAADTALWTLNVTLLDSLVKFRANDGWDVNWGSSDFPSGVGTQGGNDIPVFAGDYMVTFNSVTGEYNFTVISSIGIIGDATPGGWDADTDMYKDTTEHGFFTILDLSEGSAKFRKDNDWPVNWGSADFPMGTGVQEGDNIPVSPAGKYRITLDTMSGAYNFEAVIEFEFISLIGDATPGADWETDTDLTQDSGNADLWTGNVTLTDGGLKFRANHEWAIAWGGTDFPNGTADSGDNIPATAGDYQVTFNTATSEYSFLIIEPYETIGIIGDATPGGWTSDTDMVQDANNPELWTLRLVLTDGEALFRADNLWDASWGSADFPMGTGGFNSGINIPVTAGEYKITFNTITGEYNFEVVVVFTTVGIIGTGSPTGGWDDDFDLVQNASDEHLWELASATLTDGVVKFRAEDSWDVNWGYVMDTPIEDVWPAGLGVQEGVDIPSTAGTYSISINTNTGEYLFADPVATREEILNPSSVNVYPNPTSDRLNIDISTVNMKGEVRMTVLDMQGRVMSTKIVDASNINSLDVSNLANGNYLLQITNSKFVIGKRFNVVK